MSRGGASLAEPIAPVADALVDMLKKFESQHRMFFDDVCTGTIYALREENRRLESLLEAAHNEAVIKRCRTAADGHGARQPPLPPLPMRVFTPPTLTAPSMQMPNANSMVKALHQPISSLKKACQRPLSNEGRRPQQDRKPKSPLPGRGSPTGYRGLNGTAEEERPRGDNNSVPPQQQQGGGGDAVLSFSHAWSSEDAPVVVPGSVPPSGEDEFPDEFSDEFPAKPQKLPKQVKEVRMASTPELRTSATTDFNFQALLNGGPNMKRSKATESRVSVRPGSIAQGRMSVRGSVVPNQFSMASGKESLLDSRDTIGTILCKDQLKGEDSNANAGVTVRSNIKQRKRLRSLFGVERGTVFVTVEQVLEFLLDRGEEFELSVDEVERVFAEFKNLQWLCIGGQKCERADQCSLNVFCDLLFLPDLFTLVDAEAHSALYTLIKACQMTTVGEIVDEVTKGSNRDTTEMPIVAASWEHPLNFVVMLTVFLNLFSMAISIDIEPEHIVWLIAEIICTIVFTVEISIKMYFYGCRKFCKGPGSGWNRLDAAITLLSVLEVCLGLLIRLIEKDGGGIKEAARIAVMLRALRATRVVRLVKLLRAPLVRDLASMVVGILIGIPALFWVFLLFIVILFTLGVLFRVIFGPTFGQDLTARCGLADQQPFPWDFDDCKIHWLYGEEYFGSVKMSMFTAFRFMIGDFTSGAGQSMIVAFSQGYGDVFLIVYVGGMIAAIFGLFNIITAIFVDSTISGLKHNDVKRKYAEQYECIYVRQKLREFLWRISVLREYSGTELPDNLAKSESKIDHSLKMLDDLEISEIEFIEFMEDEGVQTIMKDLDVHMWNPAGMFDTFDGDGNGSISMAELIQAVMKLRGEPQKNDLIASWVALRSLHEKMESVQETLTAMQSSERSSRPQLNRTVTTDLALKNAD